MRLILTLVIVAFSLFTWTATDPIWGGLVKSGIFTGVALIGLRLAPRSSSFGNNPFRQTPGILKDEEIVLMRRRYRIASWVLSAVISIPACLLLWIDSDYPRWTAILGGFEAMVLFRAVFSMAITSFCIWFMCWKTDGETAVFERWQSAEEARISEKNARMERAYERATHHVITGYSERHPFDGERITFYERRWDASGKPVTAAEEARWREEWWKNND